ncbi:unnamed protein product [Ostreobium quekettii]|uniref:THH1/TOM1/TOM3 domain-containing protein n=1 Tax=Ostreobium quekettii TaxID=121088 RepID=A0A8S1J398_9CHLO|nr:unnamed protein product [Ostreobium quekettii]
MHHRPACRGANALTTGSTQRLCELTVLCVIAALVEQIILWDLPTMILSNYWAYDASVGFLSAVCLGAVVGWLVHGCLPASMLWEFPIESRRKHKMVQEVGVIIAVCSACSAARYSSHTRLCYSLPRYYSCKCVNWKHTLLLRNTGTTYCSSHVHLQIPLL